MGERCNISWQRLNSHLIQINLAEYLKIESN
jgi:hypothetical protein